MNRIIITTLFAIALSACGHPEIRALPQPIEPNNTVAYTFDGNYEVSGVSQDESCVYDDTTWNVQRAGDANAFNVDTALQTAYVRPNRALLVSNSLRWEESRQYSINGCDGGIVTTYNVSLDAHGNLTGSMSVRSTGACANTVACDYEIVSNRIK